MTPALRRKNPPRVRRRRARVRSIRPERRARAMPRCPFVRRRESRAWPRRARDSGAGSNVVLADDGASVRAHRAVLPYRESSRRTSRNCAPSPLRRSPLVSDKATERSNRSSSSLLFSSSLIFVVRDVPSSPSTSLVHDDRASDALPPARW